MWLPETLRPNTARIVPSDPAWGPPVGIRLRVSSFGDHLFAAVNPRVFRQVVIRNNVVRNMDGLAEPLAFNTGINLGYCENALVEDDVIDLPASNLIAASECTNLRFFNNRNPAGQLIQGVVGTTKQEELTTLIEDAAILAML
jgi:hypothetical protein